MSQYAVINTCYGGFGLSQEAKKLMGNDYKEWKTPRNDKLLVEVVRELGKKAEGKHAELVIVKLKPATRYVIYEFDGMESIAEDHKVYDPVANKWVFASKTDEFVREIIKTSK